MYASSARRALALLAPVAVVTALVSFPMDSASAAGSTSLVIAEVYGGGGNAGPPAATYKNDFIELRNIGADAGRRLVVLRPVRLVRRHQLAGPDALSGTLPAGSPTSSGRPPVAPARPARGIDTARHQSERDRRQDRPGQLAPPLACGADCHADAGVVDFVGYGTASDFEGTAAPAGSNTTSDSRTARVTDTDDNGADFATSDPPTPSACGRRASRRHPRDHRRRSRARRTSHRTQGTSSPGSTGVVTARAPGASGCRTRRVRTPGYVDGASSGIYVFTSRRRRPTGQVRR